MKIKNKPFRYDDHPLPRTRREFLSQGFLGYAAAIATPTLFGFGARSALAGCTGGDTGSGFVPFMAFDMAGGAALPGNFLVGKQGGAEDLLPSYDRLGWNPRLSGAVYNGFGLPVAANVSKLGQGMYDNMSPEARARLRLGSFCHFARDDSSSNELNASTLVLKLGNSGQYISNGLGLINSASGGKSLPVLQDAALKPNFVEGINDILGATNFGGDALQNLSRDQLRGLATSASKFSELHARGRVNNQNGELLSELSYCAYQKSIQFVEGVSGLDPRNDNIVQAIYGINQNTAQNDANAVAAAISMNSIRGNSGPGVWTLGGCDYHDGSFTTGDAKDLEMGIQIGRAVELAHQLQKPFFFQLFTDGGCDSVQGGREWRGDSGGKCMTVIGFYRPDAAPTYRNNGVQIGHYTDGQGADRDTLIGASPARVAYAVFANYMAVSGRLNEFSAIAGDVFTPEEIDQILIFEEDQV